MGKLLSKSEGHNENYLAKVIVVDNLRKHPNADKLQMFRVDGKEIITDMSTREGDVRILFPIESALNLEYLAENNDFIPNLNMNKDPKWNTQTNPDVKGGFFGAKGRVKALRLRQIPSEGYMVPVSTLSFLLSDNEQKEVEGMVGEEFDTIKDFLLVKKYVVKETRQQGAGGAGAGKKPKETKLIDGQVHLHTDTAQLGKNIFKVEPNSFIAISDKWHGTSAGFAYVLCKKPLKWYEKLAKAIGLDIVDTHYDLIYHSRRVVKNPDLNPNAVHFYKSDVWGETAKKIKHLMNKGESIYGEIVGFTEDGGAIQSMGGKPYDYGCTANLDGNKPRNRFVIYRITQTNVDGQVMDLSTQQLQQRAAVMGLETVPILWTGYAKDKYPELSLTEHWQENFLAELQKEYISTDVVNKKGITEKEFHKCLHCESDVWAEGIILRIEGYEILNLKLKSAAFLEGETAELDSGVQDMESAESEPEGDVIIEA